MQFLELHRVRLDFNRDLIGFYRFLIKCFQLQFDVTLTI